MPLMFKWFHIFSVGDSMADPARLFFMLHNKFLLFLKAEEPI